MSAITYRNFQSGELDPALYARVDLDRYATGLKTCRNNIVLRTGGVSNRSGTEFSGEVKVSADAARVIPFIYNDDVTFVLEFGDEYVRFHRDGAQVTEPSGCANFPLPPNLVTAVTRANPCRVTLDATFPVFESCETDTLTYDLSIGALQEGDEIIFSDIVGMTELNGRNFRVHSIASSVVDGTTSFSLQDLDGNDIDSTNYSAYISGGTLVRVYEIASPFAAEDLENIQWSQNANVMTFSCAGYVPQELSRVLDFSWAFAEADFDPDIETPQTSNNGAVGTTTIWRVQAVGVDGEESLTTTTQSSATPSGGSPIVVSWAQIEGATEYKVYRSLSVLNYKYLETVNNFIFVGGTITYSDVGAAGTSALPSTFLSNGVGPNWVLPVAASAFQPACVGYFQQRLFYGNIEGYVERAFGSQIGHFNNFFTHDTLVDSDAVAFSIAGNRKVSEVRHLMDLNGLLIGTQSGIYLATGNESGTITPSSNGQNPVRISAHGMSWVRPVFVGDSLIYVDKNSSIIRDLGTEITPRTSLSQQTKANLTSDASHLFEGKQIVDLDYQENTHSIVWAVRDDGAWLGLTYLRDKDIVAWHRHDTQGTVENVCVIPEGTEDYLYMIVKRTINGVTRRYVERLGTRLITDIVDAKFMDSSLSYDGRHTGATTMTLSGGTTWAYDEELTLTASASTFVAADVGNEVHLTSGDEIIRFNITGYTSGTVVTGKPNRTVPAAMRSAAISTWSRAVDELTNLWHLEGEDVSVFADGYVIGSPNNDSCATVYTVTNGSITLPQAYGVIHVGLPYISDLETLDVDTANSETLSDKKKIVSAVTVRIHESRGFLAGNNPGDDSLDGLLEPKLRDLEGYDEPTDLTSDNVTINIESNWNSNGRVLIRQVDPVPLTILSVTPTGLFPIRK